MKEFEHFFLSNNCPGSKIDNNKKMYALIDVANGNMSKVKELTKLSKKKYGDRLILMVGNIANPETYRVLSEAGADYCRVGVGNGSSCLTTQQLGIGYAAGSLVSECYEEYCKLDNPAKIVADGGFKKYADIIKSFSVGSTHIMLGSIFNKSLESCADTFEENQSHGNWKTPGEKVDQYSKFIKNKFNNGSKFYKKFRGMSTKEVQKELGNEKLKTSEGIVKINPVEYTIESWVENFDSYLKSAMSYTNKRNLNDFVGEVEIIKITDNAFRRYNK